MNKEDIKNNWEIWVEGYRSICEMGMPALLNKDENGKLIPVEGKNFNEACVNWFTKHEKGVKQNSMRDFNPVKLTYWECKLFDNGESAKKSVKLKHW